jgi:hypothetical protein
MKMIMDSALQKIKILPLQNVNNAKPVEAGEVGLSATDIQPDEKTSPVTVDRKINGMTGTL